MLKLIKAIILVSWFSISIFHFIFFANDMSEASLILHIVSLGLSFILIISDKELLYMNIW